MFVLSLHSLEEQQCIGVKLHDTSVCALLYADDGALVATSKEDLQCMLDALKEYCKRWRMFVNTDKTQIVVFNHPKGKSWSSQAINICYNGIRLEVVESFKYLGLMFHAVDRYNIVREHRLQQGKKIVAKWMRIDALYGSLNQMSL